MAIKFSAKPKLACEITADRVVAGRLSDAGNAMEVYTAHELAAGSVAPDLLEVNLKQRGAVLETVRDTLNSISGRGRDVIAILPDAAVRVVLLDFDTIPKDREEAEGVVRFRLKKSLPFDVDKAKVSYHPQTTANGVRVVAAVALSHVIEDYESLFREAGFSPGVVLPSMLAALGAARAEQPTLVVKVDARTTSIAILDKQQLLLFRTLENTRGAAISGEQLAEEVYPSVVFFQDTYQMNIEEIYVAGLADSTMAGPALQAQTGAAVKELIGPSLLGSSSLSSSGSSGSVPRWRMAGVVGALLS